MSAESTEIKIRLSGIIDLGKTYNGREVSYFLHLRANYETKSEPKMGLTTEYIEIPIDEKTFNTLKEKLAGSKAEVPLLLVDSELEIKLSSACLN